MRHARVAAACILAFTALAAAGTADAAPRHKPLPALTRVAPDDLSRALTAGRITPAEYALARARSLFERQAVSGIYGRISRPDPHAATLILRDLAIRMRTLGPSDRAAARRVLARPTDDVHPHEHHYTVAEATPVCDVDFCVHYVTTTDDQPEPGDADGDGLLDYVETTAATLNQVWGAEIALQGYKEPKDDSTTVEDNGGDGRIDIYIADVGADFLYGYCTTDDPNVIDASSTYQFFDASAYCVVDNDFKPIQFPAGAQGIEALQVTVAHEFFHAVQFAYDLFEDQWLIEASATWMEDEVYDDVNDNFGYLSDSPIARPTRPLDKGATGAEPCCHVYGGWIWFRFLSEWFGPDATTPDPTVVRKIWERADGSPLGVDDYSILAVRNALADRGTSFARVFAAFGWVNRVAKRWYAEGASYPNAPLSAAAMELTPGSPSRSKSVTLAHQTQRYYEFKRGRRVRATAKLRLTLDLPNVSQGAAASVLVFKKTGTVTPFRLQLSSGGNGTFTFGFGSGISKINVVLTNTSTRYGSCWQKQTPYACSGVPLDDGRVYKMTGRLA